MMVVVERAFEFGPVRSDIASLADVEFGNQFRLSPWL